MKSIVLFLISFLILNLCSVSFPEGNNLSKFQYLIGEWVGSGGGSGSGQGNGGSVYRFDLDSNVIIRENYAHYPAQNNKPEYTHKDLMVIYYQSASPKAIYFDNEKHIINYNIKIEENKLIFTSEEVKGSPQFRMTYDKPEGNLMNLNFEIAPPNTPGKFMQYINAQMKKK
jgi:hypothetical protein